MQFAVESVSNGSSEISVSFRDLKHRCVRILAAMAVAVIGGFSGPAGSATSSGVTITVHN